jgi:hypothetical protein
VGVVRKVYRVLVGKPEGKRPLGRPRRRWAQIGWGCGPDPVGSREGMVAGCCECGDEPSVSGATQLVLKLFALFTREWGWAERNNRTLEIAISYHLINSLRMVRQFIHQ